MAQPSVGTPIQLYSSATPGNVPVAANLAQGELAINVADGKLYYKTSGGAVNTIANASVATGNLPGGSAGTVVYQSATGVTAYLALGAANTVLTSNGTGPAYVSQSSLSVGTAAVATTATTATTASTVTFNTAYSAPTPVSGQNGYVLSYTGSGFAWVSAPAATTASNISGGAQYQIPFQSAVSTTTFSSNLTFNSGTNTFTATNISGTAITGTTVTASTSVTGATITANGSITTASNLGAFNYGTLSYTDTNIFASHQTSVNSYAQKIMQNTNSGSSASVDFIVSNDQGTASTYYGDFGMNSSTYSGVGSFQQPNVVYLYSISSDLVVGTQGANYLRLVTNNNSADTITLSPTNAVAFNGNYGTNGYLLSSGGTTGAPTWVSPTTIGTSQGKLYFYGQF